jgi:hypothetical protein
MKLKLLLGSCLLLILSQSSNSQSQVIKVEGDYFHRATNFKFPTRFDNYDRNTIIAFDKKNENISVSYSNINSEGKTTFTIYIYPSRDGAEGSLRSEFINSLKTITFLSKPGNLIKKYPIDFIKDRYIANGFKARINDNNNRSELLVYQCGQWFLKIRLSSQFLDSLNCVDLENKILDIYNPVYLVKKFPLNIMADIHFGKAAFADSLMLGCVMGSALNKVEWAIENVDSLERISGFPDIYLNLHKSALLEFSKFEKDHPTMQRTQSTVDYLSELNSIIDSGFLNEFIMQQFDMLLKVPADVKLDFTKFEQWEKSKSININLNQYFAIVIYTK